MKRPYSTDYSGLHTKTGKTALLQKTDDPAVVKAQFDDIKHKHSHGWTAYPLSEFEMREGRPFPSVIGPDSTSYPTHAVIYAHGITDGRKRQMIWYLSTIIYRCLRRGKSPYTNSHIAYKRDELVRMDPSITTPGNHRLTEADVNTVRDLIDHLVQNHQRSIAFFTAEAQNR